MGSMTISIVIRQQLNNVHIFKLLYTCAYLQYAQFERQQFDNVQSVYD